MDADQAQYFEESYRYCDRLLRMLEHEKETISECFRGEPLKMYIRATDEAISEVKKIKKNLKAIQSNQS